MGGGWLRDKERSPPGLRTLTAALGYVDAGPYAFLVPTDGTGCGLHHSLLQQLSYQQLFRPRRCPSHPCFQVMQQGRSHLAVSKGAEPPRCVNLQCEELRVEGGVAKWQLRDMRSTAVLPAYPWQPRMLAAIPGASSVCQWQVALSLPCIVCSGQGGRRLHWPMRQKVALPHRAEGCTGSQGRRLHRSLEQLALAPTETGQGRRLPAGHQKRRFDPSSHYHALTLCSSHGLSTRQHMSVLRHEGTVPPRRCCARLFPSRAARPPGPPVAP
eukprot:217964-Chlamydomonas_euryale.AAC.2